MTHTTRHIATDVINFGDNPRFAIDETAPAFLELMASIRDHGVFQPIHVRTAPDSPGTGKGKKKKPSAAYVLLAGERRLRAARAVGLSVIPAFDYGVIDDARAFNITIQENRHAELTPMEEARAATMAVEKCGDDYDQAATILGHTVRWVRLRARIQKHLHARWVTLTADKDYHWLTTGHLALLARLPESEQAELARGVSWLRQGPSIAALEEKLNENHRKLASAPFDTGPCAGCTKRTGAAPLLWSDDEAAADQADCCLDPGCFKQKTRTARLAVFKELSRKYKGLVPLDNRKDPSEDWALGQELDTLYGDKIVRHEYAGDETFTICKKADKGAVPALIVAGRDKGKVRYIQVRKQPAAGNGTAKPPKTTAREKAAREQRKRWITVSELVLAKVVKTPVKALPSPAVAGACVCILSTEFSSSDDRQTMLDALAASAASSPAMLRKYVTARLWASVQEWAAHLGEMGVYETDPVESEVRTLATLLGLDARAMYDDAKAAEETTEGPAKK